MKRLAILLLFASCTRHSEIRTDAQSTEAATATIHADTAREEIRQSRSRDVFQTGPIETTIDTTTTTQPPDGGPSRTVVRHFHRVAAPSSEVKETAAAEDDTKQTQRNAELNEVRKRLAKTDAVTTVKPSSCLGFRLGVVLAVLIIFGAYFAWRFRKDIPW